MRITPRRLFTILATTWSLVCAPAVAVAAAPWSDPARLPGQSGPAPLFLPPAFSGKGFGLVATERGNPPRPLVAAIVNDRPASARLISRSLRLGDYAILGSRRFVAAGTQRRGHASVVKAGFGTIGGSFGDVRAVGSGVANDLDANFQGTAAIAFHRGRGLYLAIRRPGAIRFGRPLKLSGSEHALSDAQVRVNDGGDVLVVWTASLPGRPNRSPRHEVTARIWFRRGHLSRRFRLGTGTSGFPGDLAVAFSRRRRALVGWQTFDSVRVAYASIGGHFQRTQVLDRVLPVNTDERAPSEIRVAFSVHGRAVAVWAGGAPNRSIRAAQTSGARFGPPVTISSGSADANVDSLATGLHGEFLAIWTEGAWPTSSVFAAALRPEASGSWDAPELIGQGGGSQAAIDPRTRVPFAVFQTSAGLAWSTRAPVR
jgi:hypothetical protein